jgi:hypothetical protein
VAYEYGNYMIAVLARDIRAKSVWVEITQGWRGAARPSKFSKGYKGWAANGRAGPHGGVPRDRGHRGRGPGDDHLRPAGLRDRVGKFLNVLPNLQRISEYQQKFPLFLGASIAKGEGFRGARPTPPLFFAGKTAKAAAARPNQQVGQAQSAISPMRSTAPAKKEGVPYTVSYAASPRFPPLRDHPHSGDAGDLGGRCWWSGASVGKWQRMLALIS